MSDSDPFDWEEKEGNELDTGLISTTAIPTTAEYDLLSFALSGNTVCVSVRVS